MVVFYDAIDNNCYCIDNSGIPADFTRDLAEIF